MEGGVSSAKSILEKPLKLLTEEDISQLTREDCRKFLKEKGMRKPSWNKSQAIQQVLCLKALFEPGEYSGAGTLRKILISHPPNPNHVTATSIEQTNEHRSDSPRSAEFSGSSGHYYVPEKNSYKTVSPSRSPAETSALVGQMTIFYCGKVKVYDGVTPEKARTIMQFAANPTDLPENSVFASNEKMVELPQYGLSRRNASRDPDVEGQGNRKMSLHRYREKRKDRFSKAKKTPGAASFGLEMFLNRCQPQMNAAPPENQKKSSNLFS